MSLVPPLPTPPDEQYSLLMDVRHDNDTATTRITVAGDVDRLTADQVRTTFLEAVREHQPALIEMDVHDVTFLDSAGIRMLLTCQADARAGGRYLTVIETPPMVHQVLEITALLDHLGVRRPAGPARS